MDAPLARALIAMIPACLLLAGSAVLLLRRRTLWAWLQVLGAACLALVVLTHITEALQVLPWMQWGEKHSVGHYVDLAGALLGGTLFPFGYLGHALLGRDQ